MRHPVFRRVVPVLVVRIPQRDLYWSAHLRRQHRRVQRRSPSAPRTRFAQMPMRMLVPVPQARRVRQASVVATVSGQTIGRSYADTLRLELFGFDAGAIEKPHSCEGEYTFTDTEDEVTNSHDGDNREELTGEAR